MHFFCKLARNCVELNCNCRPTEFHPHDLAWILYFTFPFGGFRKHWGLWPLQPTQLPIHCLKFNVQNVHFGANWQAEYRAFDS